MVSGLSSVALKGTSDTDALTLAKETGGAAYTLGFPAAAPAASTYLKYDGTKYEWAVLSTLPAFSAGTSGAVPAPLAGAQNKYLKSDGTWAVGKYPEKSWCYEAGGVGLSFGINSLMTFGLGVGGPHSLVGSAISKVSPGIYGLAAGNSYRIRFCCDLYNATNRLDGYFTIVKSPTTTLPINPYFYSEIDVIRGGYPMENEYDNFSYFKVDFTGYIQTSVITYIGIRFVAFSFKPVGLSMGDVKLGNLMIEIDLL